MNTAHSSPDPQEREDLIFGVQCQRITPRKEPRVLKALMRPHWFLGHSRTQIHMGDDGAKFSGDHEALPGSILEARGLGSWPEGRGDS